MKHPFQKFAALCVAMPLSAAISQAFAAEPSPVPAANPKQVGVTLPTRLSPELAQVVVAQGAMALENPVSPAAFYGYLDDLPNLLPALGSNLEATKTEPDKNTYLVMTGQHGADARYAYGTHFLYQGHEGGAGYVTRVNLDADAAHRVTLLATTDADGTALPTFDGSTWHPWSGQLLFTSERGASGGVWQASPDFPSTVRDISGATGRGGYEGIQADDDGNLWIVEDVGGSNVAGARLPNSFIYRFVPKNRRDLTQGGKLQALQVTSKATGTPIVFQAATALSADMRDLHTYGLVFDTRWVTLHDTEVDGDAPFSANALAKAHSATPFKRPENGVFRPGTHFREFFFTETGDTSTTSTAIPDHGGFGALIKLSQASPSADTGKLSLFFKGDLEHTGFDNLSFWDGDRLVVGEDRGDTLHSQGNALDSHWLFDARANYADPGTRPIRIMAEGRDPSATIDSALLGTPGFQNDGDNETTGIHVSDGDPSIQGLFGKQVPHPFHGGWRVFYTQQHGDNTTYELIPARRGDGRDD